MVETRPKRKTIKDGVFLVTAQLILDRPTGQTELAKSTAPLVLTDSWVNENFDQAGRNVSRWLDELAQRHARQTGRKR